MTIDEVINVCDETDPKYLELYRQLLQPQATGFKYYAIHLPYQNYSLIPYKHLFYPGTIIRTN